MSQSAALGDIWNANATEWQDRVQFITINAAGYESGLTDYNAGHDLPTLQDEEGSPTFAAYAAHKWYLYILSADHVLHALHYNLNIPTEAPRLVDEINALLEAQP